MTGCDMCRHDAQGWAIAAVLLMLTGLSVSLWSSQASLRPQQKQGQQTQVVLAQAQRALLTYALQPLTASSCALNCPRPGDLPCPDTNNDGVAESACSNGVRLGRLPWKTLGIGDLRDTSGERLWYAVSDRYKNNPRLLPLNLDTPGTWSVANNQGLVWDASQGQGVVAVVIAPMQPLVRADGWVQSRLPEGPVLAKNYLDVSQQGDHASPQEGTRQGFLMAMSDAHFNDVILPLTASQIHQVMQKQVLSELKRSVRCQVQPCMTYPAPAAISDGGCLGSANVIDGQCLSSTESAGRLPLDANAHWPLALQHMLDGHAQHHWFQQNGWREQVFYQPTSHEVNLVISGEALPGQRRLTPAEKTLIGTYLEASSLRELHLNEMAAPAVWANDSLERLPLP